MVRCRLLVGSKKTSGEHLSFLQPAKEVLGKVMFLHMSIILFTGGACPGGVCVREVCPGDVGVCPKGCGRQP